MSDFGHNERLLSDVLSEGSTGDFREDLLNRTLHLARRRRRFRQIQSGASLMAVVAGLGVLIWHQFPFGRIPPGMPTRPYVMVRTQPLNPAACVTTQPLTPESLVATVRTGSIVETVLAASPVHEMNDEELLSAAPQPAALVRFGPHTAELVFVDQTDHGTPLRN